LSTTFPEVTARLRRGETKPLTASRFGAGFRRGLLVGTIALAAAPTAVRLVRSWRARAAVTGESMLPGLRPGDWLLVDPDAFRGQPPRAGDVVVVPDPREPERVLVKRVRSTDSDGRLELAGDSAERSTDSRAFGSVESEEVLGRAWARYWPPARWGRVR
jgi:nickel-type superoxide dismutase maturation protease